MPGRRYMPRKLRMLTVNSLKHVVDEAISVTSTNTVKDLAKAVNSPSNTVTTDCRHGATIKALWLSLDFCGTSTSGVNQRTVAYLFKNPGANLIAPGVLAVGSSNEKKFVCKMWSAMTMRNQDGNPPYHWEGWIKLPRRYHKMGTDDIWQLVIANDSGTGHGFFNCIYKEYF